jgi:hypothetical protein
MIPKSILERSLRERICNHGGKSWNYSLQKKVYASREKIIQQPLGGIDGLLNTISGRKAMLKKNHCRKLQLLD